MEEKRKSELEWLKNRLKNISPANRTLCLARLPRNRVFSFSMLDISEPFKSYELVTELLNGGKTFYLSPVSAPQEQYSESGEQPPITEISRSLTTLFRENESLVRNKGDAYFHLGFPFLEFYTKNDNYFRAPLLLFPCSLKKESVTSKVKKLTWVVEIESEPYLNELIIDAIEKGNGFKFDADEIARLRDLCDSGDVKAIISKTVDFFRKSDFVIEGELKKEYLYKNKRGHILTKEQLQVMALDKEAKVEEYEKVSFYVCDPITQIKKDELPLKQNLNLKLFSYAVIGQFPAYSSTLIKDYEEYLNNVNALNDPIVDQIILGNCSEQENINPITDETLRTTISVHEKDRFSVLAANSTQEQIVLALRDLKQTGFVADGPPGTGKSQLIVNIVADSLALGKKVLVSCEKRAALDVVYKRLQGAGLDDHAILLHSPEKERDWIFKTISDTIEKSGKITDKKLKTVKHAFETLANDIEEDVAYLNEYAEELHKERDNGISLFTMYSRALIKKPKLKLDSALCEKYAFKEFEYLINKIIKILPDAERYYDLKMPPSIRKADSVSFSQIPSLIEAIQNLKLIFQSYASESHDIKKHYFKNELNIEEIEKRKDIFSEGLSLLQKLEKKDLVFKLLRKDISVGRVEEKISALKSLLGHLPNDFRELPVSFDTVEQDCEIISAYKSILFEIQNRIYASSQLFKKYSSQISSHGLFNKLTHYRLMPLLHEDTLETCKYIEGNKELLKIIANNSSLHSYIRHKNEIEQLQGNTKIEYILPKSHGLAIWEGVLQKVKYLKTIQKSRLRFLMPKWYKNKKEIDQFLHDNIALRLHSVDKIEELVNSNISYLLLKEYLKPLYSDLEITDICDVNQIYAAIESFKTVIKSLEALCQLYNAYYEFSKLRNVSFIEVYSQVEALTRKYGVVSDVKPEKLLRDLHASQIIKNNEPIFAFFNDFDGFAHPITADSLNRFMNSVTSQIESYKKLAVVIDDFDAPPMSEKYLDRELPAFIDTYNGLIHYVHLRNKFRATVKDIQGNFALETVEKMNSAVTDENVFIPLLDDIKYYLENYESERQWHDISSQLNEVERKTVMSLCEVKSDDPCGEMTVAYCKYWIEKLENENDKIRSFKQVTYDLKRNNLNNKLEEKRRVCSDYISCLVKKQGYQVVSNGQLIHDLRLKRRKKSVRYVFKNYFKDIQRLFPVVLMSPENVSQCLPNKTDLFNLVIFDEASQIEVYKAIPSVFRGEAVFVTGDEHQLPPNRVGVALYDDTDLPDNYDPDNIDLQDSLDSRAVESFLDQCVSRFSKYNPTNSSRSGRKMLDWHYRSEHEALINFSNHAFYNGQIQICPHPGQYLDYHCIKYHKVSGYFIKRRNIVEAQEVVRLLKNYWITNDHKKVPTIGVVTFSLEQQNAIWDEIDRECVNNQVFGEAYQRELSRKEGEEDIGFFIRNIENVQGDQRDIIIFSIGYAPRAPGEKIEMQFGVFSREKGENRLNVAITRAKKEVHIVASIEPEELRVESTTHRGPKVLQGYLRYCRLIDQSKLSEARRLLFSMSSLEVPEGQETLSFDSEFEQEVYNFLRQKGYAVHSQVGCSKYKIDLAVVDPQYDGRYLCGIECDGVAYHSGIDARERDIYRQSFLESKKWKILRIWSSYWYKNQEDARNRLINSINGLTEQSKKSYSETKKHVDEDLEEKKTPDADAHTTIYKQPIPDRGCADALNRCPECGSEYKVATNGHCYSLYCPTCQWKKIADLDELTHFLEEGRRCKNHPLIKLKPKKSVRGLFLSCPSCYYVEALKIKDKFLYCPSGKGGQKNFFL